MVNKQIIAAPLDKRSSLGPCLAMAPRHVMRQSAASVVMDPSGIFEKNEYPNERNKHAAVTTKYNIPIVNIKAA